MKNYTRILTLLLVLLLVVEMLSVNIIAFTPIDTTLDVYEAAGSQPSKYSSQYNSGQRDVVATTLNGTSADSYYSGQYEYDVLSEKSATEIRSALATLMKSTHSYISTYDDCHYKAHRTDCENETGSSNKLSLIYTSYTATQSQWNGWNREHVWPKSLGGDTTTGGGADLHHIRPSDASVNSSRGNKKYGESNGGTAKYGSNPATGYLGGYYNSTYFEPRDEVKGDVARICLYVWIRWGSSWGATDVTKVFQSIDVLLEWCELDPVDTWELGRNEVVQDIQGNRNVFIDYPEYAWLVFGKEVPTDMQTPSGEASENAHEHSWNSGSVTTEPTCTTSGVKTFTCTTCGEIKTETITSSGHSWGTASTVTDATCTTAGTKKQTCSTCGAYKNITIAALGHSWSEWVTDKVPTEQDSGSKHRTCSTCSEVETTTIPPLGHEHTYTSEVTDPTCTEKGYTTYTCACGDSYKDSYTNALSHSFKNGLCIRCDAPDEAYIQTLKTNFVTVVDSLPDLKGEELYNKICEALEIYSKLPQSTRNDVSDKYDNLTDIIATYNVEAGLFNEEADSIDSIFVGGVVTSVSLLAYALYSLLGKKII